MPHSLIKWDMETTKGAGNMAEEKSTVKKTAVAERKVAPDVIVNSPARKSSIDELLRDNPNKAFVYAPAGSSIESLNANGLKPIAGIGGKRMVFGSREVVEDIGGKAKEDIKAAHQAATERADELKDHSQSNSADKTARAKKPNS